MVPFTTRPSLISRQGMIRFAYTGLTPPFRTRPASSPRNCAAVAGRSVPIFPGGTAYPSHCRAAPRCGRDGRTRWSSAHPPAAGLRRHRNEQNIHKAPPAARPAAGWAFAAAGCSTPMWGIFSPQSGRRRTMPGISPSPATPAPSSLPSNNACIPRQIPKKGTPEAAVSRMTGISPLFPSASIASAKAPTPGRITPSAAAISAASPVIRAGSFSRRKADSTLRRFPAP